MSQSIGKNIRKLRKENKDAIIVVMGCYSQKYHLEAINDCDADIVVGTSNRKLIPQLIKEYINSHKKLDFCSENSRLFKYEELGVVSCSENTRAYLKIQDGCNNFCSYCIIPYVRGRVRSKNYDKCINEARDLVNSGHKEIVLAGIHTGQYNDNGKRLSDVINGLSKIDGLERIRLSSVEIVELDEGMLEILKNNNKFVSHLHIPLQAGSNNVLKLMNRRYTREEFIDMVNNIKKLRPGISLSTDIIVGFPGETEEEFYNTYKFFI